MAKFLQLEITSVCTDIMSFLTYQLGTTIEYLHTRLVLVLAQR
jgi:hypothetical protein